MKSGYAETLISELREYRDQLPSLEPKIIVGNPYTGTSYVEVHEPKSDGEKILFPIVMRLVARSVGVAEPKRQKDQSFLFR